MYCAATKEEMLCVRQYLGKSKLLSATNEQKMTSYEVLNPP
jgi:hypothetical protein